VFATSSGADLHQVGCVNDPCIVGPVRLALCYRQLPLYLNLCLLCLCLAVSDPVHFRQRPLMKFQNKAEHVAVAHIFFLLRPLFCLTRFLTSSPQPRLSGAATDGIACLGERTGHCAHFTFAVLGQFFSPGQARPGLVLDYFSSQLSQLWSYLHILHFISTFTIVNRQ
jgi:hypothetical protein